LHGYLLGVESHPDAGVHTPAEFSQDSIPFGFANGLSELESRIPFSIRCGDTQWLFEEFDVYHLFAVGIDMYTSIGGLGGIGRGEIKRMKKSPDTRLVAR
jgi:hypothetical protein